MVGLHRRLWLWITLFVVSIVLIIALFTGWNVVLVDQYSRMIDLAGQIRHGGPGFVTRFWLTLVLGSLGFLALLVGIVFGFVRLVREMRYTKLQAEFLARVSHELQSPLTGIELASSMLRAGPASPDEEGRLWTLLESELSRLKTEIGTLLEASRTETTGWRLDPERVDVETWLATAIPRWQIMLGAEGSLTRDGEAVRGELLADPRILDLIGNNLIDNCRKFRRPGSRATVRVRTSMIATDPNRPRFELAFEDEGIGFPPEAGRKIFKRFYRVPTLTGRKVPGTGLGLYFVHSACRALGLRISAESAGPDRGATFRIEGELEKDRQKN